MKKKQLLMATLIIALGAAVAVNWYYTENPIEISPSAEQSQVTGNLGDSVSVDGNAESEQQVQSVMADANYFTSQRLKRDEAYDEILDGIEELAEKEQQSAEQSDKILQLLDRYSRNMKVQSDAESLITAKTGSDCFVVINEEACQVIMEKNTLNDTVILQITEIIEKNIKYATENDLCICVGEFGFSHTDGDVDEDFIMKYCQENQIGYLGWSWKGNSDGLLDMANSWDGNLTDWGKSIVFGENGIKATSKPCSIFK